MEKFLENIKQHKVKLSLFILGYLLMATDSKMSIAFEETFIKIDMIYLIIYNFIFLFILFFTLKKVLFIFKDIQLKNTLDIWEALNYIRIISLGSLAGFFALVAQSFIYAVLPY